MPESSEKAPVVLKGREMAIPAASKRIGVRGDRNAESITFLLERYYDSIDFMGKDIYLEFFAPKNNYDIAKMDYTLEEGGVLRFEWVVTPLAAAIKGTVKIRIRVTDGVDYVWQSYNGEFSIEETFNPSTPMPPPGLSVVEELIIKLKAMLDELEQEPILAQVAAITTQITALAAQVTAHLKDFSNPHQVTEDQLLAVAPRFLLEITDQVRPYVIDVDGKVTYIDNLTDAGKETLPNDIGVLIP